MANKPISATAILSKSAAKMEIITEGLLQKNFLVAVDRDNCTIITISNQSIGRITNRVSQVHKYRFTYLWVYFNSKNMLEHEIAYKKT